MNTLNENNKRIRELRMKSGLSQNDFAQKFCMNVQTLQKWEQGINNTPKHVVYMIETILNYENNKQ